jgi:hypothetical protein
VQYGGLICDNQDGTFAIHATLVPTSSGYSGSGRIRGHAESQHPDSDILGSFAVKSSCVSFLPFRVTTG